MAIYTIFSAVMGPGDHPVERIAINKEDLDRGEVAADYFPLHARDIEEVGEIEVFGDEQMLDDHFSTVGR